MSRLTIDRLVCSSDPRKRAREAAHQYSALVIRVMFGDPPVVLLISDHMDAEQDKSASLHDDRLLIPWNSSFMGRRGDGCTRDWASYLAGSV